VGRPIPIKLVEDTARELTARAAIDIPPDYREGVRQARDRERGRLARFVLTEMLANWELATAERRPMCADTGLPRYYVRVGNEAVIEGGFVALERALRRATAEATATVPLRPNRVHPLTRTDHNNNVGIHAPEVTYAFEPGRDFIDLTTVHKGGLFGSDYRMLFPADGVGGLKRFFVDTLIQFGRRGLACQPAIVGVGIGGAKDTCVRLGKEAACLRAVGSRNPDPTIAALEDELTTLGNYIGVGAMGFAGSSLVVATHVEVAYSHTGGMPVGIHSFCLSSRRATARLFPDGRVEFRTDPEWFTDYYRRTGVE
jgi:L(+)-tartrate dehydratase alpha subunit